mgnify:CR=1 FL=1
MRYVPHVNPFTEVRTSFILMHSESMGKSGKVKPTTKDLARAAGVSLATVDRVLNDRPGVTYKTKTAVEEAIRQLRYERNHAAAALFLKHEYGAQKYGDRAQLKHYLFCR